MDRDNVMLQAKFFEYDRDLVSVRCSPEIKVEHRLFRLPALVVVRASDRPRSTCALIAPCGHSPKTALARRRTLARQIPDQLRRHPGPARTPRDHRSRDTHDSLEQRAPCFLSLARLLRAHLPQARV